MKLTRRSVNLGLTASLVTPVFSRVARAAGETIKIGMVTRSRRRHPGRYTAAFPAPWPGASCAALRSFVRRRRNSARQHAGHPLGEVAWRVPRQMSEEIGADVAGDAYECVAADEPRHAPE